MHYRAEVDGLRAVAVLPVMLFHAGVPAFGGGFVGVDVFFVISGYLITSIIAAEIDAGHFTILGFYERRARRILPALFLVILCCLPLAWMLLLPSEMASFARSVAAVSLFASNILFWRESGYFSDISERTPLLHTWSLAVEEQYYMLFPLLLAAIWKLGRPRILTILLLIAAASFVLCELGWRFRPTANFYLAPSRVWELLAGACCSLWQRQQRAVRSTPLSLLGLGAILTAIVLFDRDTPFPSAHALLPVGGTVLVLLFGSVGTLTCTVLSQRWIVFVGLISYSAYLWHQPLFAFARIYLEAGATERVMVGLCGLALVLATLSWRFVELPFRRRGPDKSASARRAVGIAAAASALMVAVGLAGVAARGFPSRFSPELIRLTAALTDQGRYLSCQDADPERLTADGPCRLGAASGPIDFLLIGDSHAISIADGVSEAARAVNRAGLVLSASSCLPLIGAGSTWPQSEAACRKLQNGMVALAVARGVKTVLLHARWDNLDDSFILKTHGARDGVAAFERPLVETVAAFRAAGLDVVILAATPIMPFVVPTTLARWKKLDPSVDLRQTLDEFSQMHRSSIALFARPEIRQQATIVPLHTYFCGRKEALRCELAEGERAYFFDKHHLTRFGSLALSEMLSPALVRRP